MRNIAKYDTEFILFNWKQNDYFFFFKIPILKKYNLKMSNLITLFMKKYNLKKSNLSTHSYPTIAWTTDHNIEWVTIFPRFVIRIGQDKFSPILYAQFTGHFSGWGYYWNWILTTTNTKTYTNTNTFIWHPFKTSIKLATYCVSMWLCTVFTVFYNNSFSSML